MSRLYAVTISTGSLDTLERCVGFMNRQRTAPDMWVIARAAGSAPVEGIRVPITVPYMVVDIGDSDGPNALAAALEYVPDDTDVCVFTETAWYGPEYVRWVKGAISRTPVFTCRDAVEYNTAQRIWQETSTLGSLFSDIVCLGIASSVLSRAISAARGLRTTRRPLLDLFTGLGGEPVKCDKTHGAHIFTDSSAKHRPVDENGGKGWRSDKDCVSLHKIVGDDIGLYMSHDGKVYVFSNVPYPEDRKLDVGDDDILIFLNTAASVDYYEGHKHRFVYRRYATPPYGEERLGVFNRCIFGCGDYGIPDSFIDDLEKRYDWNYVIESGNSKSATTGYIVAKYMEHAYPLRDVVLVNFGYGVSKSTYRCPWHNWEFEYRELESFEHVFTADMAGEDNPALRKIERAKSASKSEQELTGIFTSTGCDQMVAHDYGEVYDKCISYVRNKPGGVAAVLQDKTALVKALVGVLPGRDVYGICTDPSAKAVGATVTSGSRYAPDGWASIPKGLSLIIDDGSHKLSDMLAGIPVFLDHLADDGILLIEDIPTEEAVDTLLGVLPGAVCYRTTPVSPYDDDRIVVYSKSGIGVLDENAPGLDDSPVSSIGLDFAALVESVLIAEDSDRATVHDYSTVFAEQFSRLVGRSSRVLEVGRADGAGLRAMRKLLPQAEVYGILKSRIIYDGGAVVVVGDGYSQDTWDEVSGDFDLIIDDGSHDIVDIERGIPVFLRHLRPGGVLMVEDVRSEDDVQAIIRMLPGAVCHRTTPRSPSNDDRIVVYTAPTTPG